VLVTDAGEHGRGAPERCGLHAQGVDGRGAVVDVGGPFEVDRDGQLLQVDEVGQVGPGEAQQGEPAARGGVAAPVRASRPAAGWGGRGESRRWRPVVGSRRRRR
jgi:hypothetical protein